METTKSPSPELISKIKQEALTSDVLKAVLMKFSTRLRNRATITPAGMKLALHKDGTNFTKNDYGNVLKFLADVGVGTLETGPRGQVKSLNKIKLDLKTIGSMVLGTPSASAELPAVTVEPVHVSSISERPGPYSVELVIDMDGEFVKFPGMSDLAPSELGKFLLKFARICQKASK